MWFYSEMSNSHIKWNNSTVSQASVMSDQSVRVSLHGLTFTTCCRTDITTWRNLYRKRDEFYYDYIKRGKILRKRVYIEDNLYNGTVIFLGTIICV